MNNVSRLLVFAVSALVMAPAYAQESAPPPEPVQADAAPAQEIAQTEQEGQATAAQLVDSAQKGLAYVVALARQNKELAAENAKTKPFWGGLQDANKNLETASKALASKDEKFFTSMASANAGFVQAEVALIMNGVNDKSLTDGMKLVGGTLEKIHQNYSREAARLKEGGELTAAEKSKLDKLIAQQDELMKKLDQVEKNAAKNNAEMKAGIEKIKKESRKIRNSRRNVGGFVGGFFSAHFLYDWIWGWHWWWGPWGGWCPGFIDVGIIVWDDWAADIAYDWGYMDALTDIDDLDLDLVDDFDASLYDDSMSYLDEGEFGFDGDMAELTQDLDFGWDDVSTDTGMELMERVEDNFDSTGFYDVAEPIDTFQDYGMDDFGGADFGFDMDFGGFDF